MKKSQILLILLLIYTIGVFGQTNETKASAWQVKKYDISASTSDRYLNAKAILNIQNVGNASGSRLTLRINPKAEIITVKVNESETGFTKGEEKLSTSTTLQRIIISLPSIPPDGTLTVSVDYKLKVDENSGVQAISPVGTQFLPQSFWYPTPNSWVAPKGGDFAPINLKINSTDSIISSQNPRLFGQPFFLTGSWDSIESQGIGVFLPKGASADERKRGEELAGIVASAKSYVANLLGETDTKFRVVAVRRGAGFADSGTILLDYAAFRRQKIDSQTVMTIAESIAKTWIGNIKPLEGEGYGVIREGLSRYIATAFVEKQYGSDVADIERFRQRVSYANVAKTETPITISTPLDSSYFVVSANKGAMIWRLAANEVGQDSFFKLLKSKEKYTLADLRATFAGLSGVFEFSFSNSNDTDLLVGLPQVNGAETKVVVRNTGSSDVTVNVMAITENGQKIIERTKILAKNFGEVSFKSTSKIIRTEIDPEKMYPQIEYSNDTAPREFTESNPLVAIKRSFDKQDFVGTERVTRLVLQNMPRLDEVRTWLGRSLLGQNKFVAAEQEFRQALSEKIPAAATMAWANLGLAEIAMNGERKVDVVSFLEKSLSADGEYGAALSAMIYRQKNDSSPTIDVTVKSFFTDFDKAAVTGRKSEVERYISGGEIPKFAAGVSAGQPEKWDTKVIRTENIDSNYMRVETSLMVKRLGVETFETGNAVFILVKVGSQWKLSGIEIFEVR